MRDHRAALRALTLATLLAPALASAGGPRPFADPYRGSWTFNRNATRATAPDGRRVRLASPTRLMEARVRALPRMARSAYGHAQRGLGRLLRRDKLQRRGKQNIDRAGSVTVPAYDDNTHGVSVDHATTYRIAGFRLRPSVSTAMTQVDSLFAERYVHVAFDHEAGTQTVTGEASYWSPRAKDLRHAGDKPGLRLENNREQRFGRDGEYLGGTDLGLYRNVSAKYDRLQAVRLAPEHVDPARWERDGRTPADYPHYVYPLQRFARITILDGKRSVALGPHGRPPVERDWRSSFAGSPL